MVGKTLGHYRVLEKLGAGGMGEVYRAEDTTLKRQIALKVLPAGLASRPDTLRRFRREAETLAALGHPNIVAIHSLEEVDLSPDGSPPELVHFLTMELVEGTALRDEITPGGLSLDRFFSIAIPLTDALAAAHERGVIHRDLKPENVMVSNQGEVKAVDFGLAKILDLATSDTDRTAAPTEALETQPGSVMGTIGYMSPEQVRGEEVDPRSDVFSLGAVLFEMATGSRAFDAPSGPEVMSAILRDQPPPIDQQRRDLPHHLGRVIRRCMAKEPERRYCSARDVLNELEDLARELEIAKALDEHLPSESAGRSSSRGRRSERGRRRRSS